MMLVCTAYSVYNECIYNCLILSSFFYTKTPINASVAQNQTTTDLTSFASCA